MEGLRIHLLGGFLLEWGEHPLPPIPSRLGRSLFAYLVVHRQRPLMRELLAGLFWPDLAEGRARRRLSHTLWQVQDALSEVCDPLSYLRVTADELSFEPKADYWLDVEEFERVLDELSPRGAGRPLLRAVDLEELQQCVDLYRGDFLAGFYDEWVTPEQQRLGQRFLGALEQLIQLEKAHGNHEEALTYARRLTHHDPLREEAHQEVMRLCYLLGRVNEALQQYERCRSVLAEELETNPSPATTALRDKIARYRKMGLQPFETETVTPLFQREGRAPFVGRQSERAALVDALEGTLGGRGGLLLVEGEPGIGKTRLLQEVTEDARWRGFEVLWGACHQLSAFRPYGALTEALAGGLNMLRAEQLAEQVDGIWLREVAQLIPDLEPWLPSLPPSIQLWGQEGLERMREALVQLVLALANHAPYLIVIDDLQWADQDTLSALMRLADRLAGTRILVCVTYRHDEARQRVEVWESVRALDRQAGRGRVLLGPLSVFETAELVGRGLDSKRVPSRSIARLHRETSGIPLFVLETLRALQEEGRPLEDLEGELPLATSIYDLVSSRVSALGPEVRSVLETAAVHGSEVDLPALLASTEGSRKQVLQAVDEAVRGGLLVWDRDRCRFFHELVRRVVYAEISAEDRPRMHVRVAAALEELHPDRFEELSHHFIEGGLPEKALDYAWQAARRAEALYGYDTAARHYAAAVRLADAARPGPDRLFEVLGAYEATLGVLGRRHDQDEILALMEPLAEQRHGWLAEVDRRRAWLLAHTDRFEEAEQAARRSLQLSEVSEDPQARGGALAALGTILSWSGRSRQAIPHLRAALAAHQGNLHQEAEARQALGTALSYLEYGEAVAQLEEALATSRSLRDPRGEAETLGVLGAIHMERGESEAAERAYTDALSICRTIGYRHGEGVNLVNLGNLHYVSGRAVRAVHCYEQATEVFRAIGNARGRAMVEANAASVYHTLLGDDERAARSARSALSFFEEIGDERGEAQCLDVIGGIARRRGERARARRQLRTALGKAEKSGRRWLEVQIQRSVAELELDEGKVEAALALLRSAEETCREVGLRDVEVGLLGMRGLAHLEAGDFESALEATSSAMNGLGPSVERAYLVPYWHARVLGRARPGERRDLFVEQAYQGLMTALEGLSPQRLDAALASVPEHRAIVEEFRSAAPRRVSLDMPAARCPHWALARRR